MSTPVLDVIFGDEREHIVDDPLCSGRPHKLGRRRSHGEDVASSADVVIHEALQGFVSRQQPSVQHYDRSLSSSIVAERVMIMNRLVARVKRQLFRYFQLDRG